jgi:hypothetical protein
LIRPVKKLNKSSAKASFQYKAMSGGEDAVIVNAVKW